jgi:hypothetical protein
MSSHNSCEGVGLLVSSEFLRRDGDGEDGLRVDGSWLELGMVPCQPTGKGFMETDLTESSFLDRGSLQPLIRLNSERINRLKDLSISYLDGWTSHWQPPAASKRDD